MTAAYKRHNVRVKDPHPCSLAAGILLVRRLREVELGSWFTFRAEFLAKSKKNGELVCHYCGKTGLQEDIEGLHSAAGLSTLATIDHVIPRSKGGAERDEKNLVVACFKCNQKKKDKIIMAG